MAGGTGANSTGSRKAFGSMLDLTAEDMADIFGAEARFNDPVFSAQLEQTRAQMARHKSFVVHLLASRAAPGRIAAAELRRVVQATCAFWRLP
mmetsp:Transcript_6065/g.16969  ORF Transcript_6065/g.16969 Transcript_6065/m.16969 type:complete len:93 (-) Transcript_6065:163-441(-)